jgi:hypothetical protein
VNIETDIARECGLYTSKGGACGCLSEMRGKIMEDYKTIAEIAEILVKTVKIAWETILSIRKNKKPPG